MYLNSLAHDGGCLHLELTICYICSEGFGLNPLYCIVVDSAAMLACVLSDKCNLDADLAWQLL